jgi:hypothetical protein
VLNAARRSTLQKNRHALATRMRDRACDYLRFARDLRVPFGNNPAEQVIRMSKLRIKVSGCIRSMAGAEVFCAVRSYLAIASRHGISWLDALIRAAEGIPGSPSRPETPGPARSRLPSTQPGLQIPTDLSSYARVKRTVIMFTTDIVCGKNFSSTHPTLITGPTGPTRPTGPIASQAL